jgi:hypothetical protein
MLDKTKTKIATPLARKAVLVSVNISQWTARKMDKKVTKETNERHHASEDAGRYNKLLIEAEHLKKLNAIVSKARDLHYSMTRPWADEGPRILPNKLFTKFTNEFRVLKRDFALEADAFCRAYPEFVEERKIKLNGMFNKDDYPEAKEIRSKFNLDMTILPLPDVEDFRSDLDDDTVADIKREIAETAKDVIGDAMKATAKEIVDKVGHMATKLREYGQEGKRSFFFDSLVDNVRELAELLPAFNLTEDTKLANITTRISKELCADDASVLRDNEAARKAVQKSADQIVKEVGALFA